MTENVSIFAGGNVTNLLLIVMKRKEPTADKALGSFGVWISIAGIVFVLC